MGGGATQAKLIQGIHCGMLCLYNSAEPKIIAELRKK